MTLGLASIGNMLPWERSSFHMGEPPDAPPSTESDFEVNTVVEPPDAPWEELPRGLSKPTHLEPSCPDVHAAPPSLFCA